MPDLRRVNPFNKGKKNSFEPSIDAKQKWLLTRKKRFGRGSTSLPGLFTTEKFASDQLFFIVAIIAEGVGLYFIWEASRFSTTFIYLVIAAFLVDIFSAIGLHWYSGDKLNYENQMRLYENFVKSENEWDNDGKLPVKSIWWPITKYIFSVFIIGLALLKIAAFYLLPPQTIDGITIGICMSYLFVAYVHLFHTGYFISEVLVDKWFFRRSYNKYYKLGKGVENKSLTLEHRESKFNSGQVSLTKMIIENGRHVLEPINSAANGGNNYQFKTWGILTDNDLQNFIDGQDTPEAVGVIAMHGHRHQMDILIRDAQVETEVGSKDQEIDQGQIKDLEKESNPEHPSEGKKVSE